MTVRSLISLLLAASLGFGAAAGLRAESGATEEGKKDALAQAEKMY
jgi:hypothetical protein